MKDNVNSPETIRYSYTVYIYTISLGSVLPIFGYIFFSITRDLFDPSSRLRLSGASSTGLMVFSLVDVIVLSGILMFVSILAIMLKRISSDRMLAKITTAGVTYSNFFKPVFVPWEKVDTVSSTTRQSSRSTYTSISLNDSNKINASDTAGGQEQVDRFVAAINAAKPV